MKQDSELQVALANVTPEALDLFRQMQQAEEDCVCESDNCPACQRWWKLHAELHDALQLRPWNWPAVLHPKTPPLPGGWFPQWDRHAKRLYRHLDKLVAATEHDRTQRPPA